MSGKHRHTSLHTWAPSPWARMLRQADAGALELVGDEIVIISGTRVAVPTLAHATLSIRREGAWWTVTTPGGEAVRGLRASAIRQFRSAVDEALADHDATAALASVDTWWGQLQQDLGEAWRARRWVTEREITAWDASRIAALPQLSQHAKAVFIPRVDFEVWNVIRSPARAGGDAVELPTIDLTPPEVGEEPHG